MNSLRYNDWEKTAVPTLLRKNYSVNLYFSYDLEILQIYWMFEAFIAKDIWEQAWRNVYVIISISQNITRRPEDCEPNILDNLSLH